jgi:hypothetical protein
VLNSLAKRCEYVWQLAHRPRQLVRMQQAAVPHGVHLQACGSQSVNLGLLIGRGDVFTDNDVGP